MKILKWGTIKRNELGGVTVSGFHIDCEEGEPMNLEDLIKIGNLLPDGVEVVDKKDFQALLVKSLKEE